MEPIYIYIYAKNDEGNTPLDVACVVRHIEVMKLLRWWMVAEVLSLCDMWEVVDLMCG